MKTKLIASKYQQIIIATVALVFSLVLSPAAYAVDCVAPNDPPGCTPVATSGGSGNAQAACEGLDLTGQGCDSTSGPSVNSTIAFALSALSFAIGVAAVIMVMIGGFKYIIASGDSNNIQSAKNTILYALIGLAIAVLAQVLVRFVLNQASPASGTPTP